MRDAPEVAPQYGENLLALFFGFAHLDLFDRPVATDDADRDGFTVRRQKKLHQQTKRLHLLLVLGNDRNHDARLLSHRETIVVDRARARIELYR